MARKRFVSFCGVKFILKSVSVRVNRLIPRLIFLAVFLLTAVLPVLAKASLLAPPVKDLPDAWYGKSHSEQVSDLPVPLLVQQGRQLYDAGQFVEAARVWQQAAQAYQTQNDGLNQAMVLSNLSLAYQQLGQWSEAKNAIASSLKLLQTEQGDSRQNRSKEQLSTLAQALNTQGSLQFSLGETQLALSTWEQATATYAQVGDQAGVIRSQINQAQALEELGFNRRALDTLTQVNETLQGQPNSLLKVNGLQSLGNVLQEIGDLDQSRQVLEQSLAIAKASQSSPDISAALFSLGNVARSQQDTKAALDFYQQAEGASASPTTRVEAQLNQLSLLLETNQESAAQALSPQIQAQLANLPANRTTVYARINYAQSLTRIKKSGAANTPSWVEIAQVLATAVQQAKDLGDQRATAYALGNLGGVYEATQQWSIAQNLTQQALLLAETNNAPDIAYRWQWQLGRLLKAREDIPGAIAAYTQAVNALQSLRGDLVAINPDVQFSFREGVEPVYRELVALLLQPKGGVNGGEPSQENLLQARNVIESLQLAELVNFFGENCLSGNPVQIDQIDQRAAVIYPIILNDRLEVILSLPQQPLSHFTTPLSQTQVESTVLELRNALRQEYSKKFLSVSQQVYDWLIRPIEADLAKSGVQTLVFLLDGSLRNIPMATLHDGKQYIVEKYALALTPGLQLLDPKPLVRQQIKVLTAGITEARQDFSPLPNVELELKEIQAEVPSTVLLNQTFTSSNLQKEIKSSSFPVVHLATHGQFSSKAEDTFILTWDDRINIKQLNNVLKTRDRTESSIIELLVLSACQTAVGDKRAALGLAGMAVRAGARSTLASLWSVNDAATASFMIQFYQNLADSKVTKAEAVRRAQQSLLQNPEYSHPYFWAPFILVGNWL